MATLFLSHKPNSIERLLGRQLRNRGEDSVLKKQALGLFVVAFVSIGTALAITAPTGSQTPAPDLDIRTAHSNNLSAPPNGLITPGAMIEALDALRAQVPDLKVRWSSLTGAPSRLYSLTSPLTDASTAPAQDIAIGFLRSRLALFNLEEKDLTEAKFSRDFVTQHNGLTHLTVQLRIQGIDVFGSAVNINIDRNGRILNVAGELVPKLTDSIGAPNPTLSSAAAIQLASQAAGVASTRTTRAAGMVYFPQGPAGARLAWDVTVEDARSANVYRTLVDAADGTILWRHNLTYYSHVAAHAPVFTSDSPFPNSPGGTGTGQVARVDTPLSGLVRFPHADPHADWWNGGPDPTRTVTRSNNVFAHHDRDNDNDDSEGFPPAVAMEDFTFPLASPIDQTADPVTYTSAATVQLFYGNNLAHDQFYRLGFDEPSGNFQVDNFGLGGSGGDPVQADSQDDATDPEGARCNANMSTPADGSSPRMQMYVCERSGGLIQDGDLDAEVYYHEYTHGVHSRLVPTLTGSQGGMGEGWGDFFAISFLSEPTDDLLQQWKVGRWLFFPGGIRRQPYDYTQDFFTRTYADIVDGSTCSIKVCSNDPTMPCSEDEDCGMGNTCDATACMFDFQCQPPATTIAQGICAAEVHNTGELWAETLWIARANLVFKYGFATGATTLLQDVIDGMKLAAPMPDFLDMRDAILLADQTNNGGVNQCLLWNAFARMGLGVSALSTGPADINPIEAFDTPSTCTPNIQVSGPTDFGDVCIDGSRDLQLEISNTGTGELIVTSISRISGSSQISLGPVNPTLPAAISAGAHLDFNLRCEATTLGPHTAVFRIESTDPDQGTIDLTYTCNTPAPDVRVTGSTEFGDVCAETTAEKAISVCNTGPCDLHVTSVAFEPPCADFTLIGNPFPATVSHDSCLDVTIRFTPTSPGPKSCTLVIRTDDPDSPLEALTVTGNTPSASIDVPPDLGFPPTVIQSIGACSTPQPFPISNTGACNLKITDVAVSTNPEEYSLAGLPSFPIILEPGHIAGEGDLAAVFAPDNLSRAVTGELTVTFVSDPIAGTTTSVTRALCGEGVRTGARVLVTAGGIPLATVEQIKLQRINANRNRRLLDTVDTSRNLALQTVVPGAPCAPFQYHQEYSTVANPIQLLPGSYQLTVTARVNGHRVKRSVGFDVTTCGFNATIVVDF